MSELFDLLSAPFHPDDIEWRAGATTQDKTKAMALAYITSRAVMDRLDEVVGAANWRDEYQSGPDGGVLCGLSLKIDGEWVTKWDGAENTDFEAVKGGLSDAFKRAGYKWGIGRYLYKVPSVWVACEQRGKSIVLKETPKLPGWALPVTLADKPKREPEQILAELGFDAEIQGATMSLETAMKVKNSEGKEYGSLSNEQLSMMTLGIDKGLKNPKTTPEHAEELQMKREAIKIILAARAG